MDMVNAANVTSRRLTLVGDLPAIADMASPADMAMILARFRRARSIAVVGSSGTLLHSKTGQTPFGAEIDAADAVFRVNDAITAGCAPSLRRCRAALGAYWGWARLTASLVPCGR